MKREDLRALHDSEFSSRLASSWKQWRQRYLAFIQRVQSADHDEWMTAAFQKELWESDDLGKVGMGSSVVLTTVYDDRQVAEVLWRARQQNQVEDRGAREDVISGERRPDAIVGLFGRDELVRWVAIDAKYRASRTAIHEGLADAHVYQDALRWNSLRASGSFIAVPACSHEASVYSENSYLETNRFGALVTSRERCFGAPIAMLLGHL